MQNLNQNYVNFSCDDACCYCWSFHDKSVNVRNDHFLAPSPGPHCYRYDEHDDDDGGHDDLGCDGHDDDGDGEILVGVLVADEVVVAVN